MASIASLSSIERNSLSFCFLPQRIDDDDLPNTPNASSSSAAPFLWEEKPGVPKSKPTNSIEQDNDAIGNEDFEFNFSGLLDRIPLTAY
ncbi:hypothetical protein K1719_016833 [Acacia pycnantha]|nr:hypothetical protein K1719_016833 [Acacia pycnantha]